MCESTKENIGTTLSECTLCNGLVPNGPQYYNGQKFGKYYLCKGCRFNNNIKPGMTEAEVEKILKGNGRIK